MAKKNKPAKKTAPKKAVAKKPVKKTVKKAAPKKSPAKKPKPAKKTAPKKAIAKKPVKKTVKKVTAKKTAVKKALPKKAAAKKPAVKKAAAKKIMPKKTMAKKPVAKKASPKKVVPVKVILKPVSPARRKKTEPVQKTMPAVIPVAIPLPAIPALSSPEDLVGKAANIETDRQQMMVPGDGLDEAPPVTEHRATASDRNAFNRATAKGVPHSNMQFSTARKGSKQHSGKKPLWRK